MADRFPYKASRHMWDLVQSVMRPLTLVDSSNSVTKNSLNRIISYRVSAAVAVER